METIILSQTMQAFIASGVPQYGSEKPFTLTMGAMDFEAITWWDANDHYTVGIVLTDMKYLMSAIVAMHDYILEECSDPEFPVFPYYMALIVPSHIADSLQRFKAPECFEMYVVELESKQATCYIGAPHA